ncbi:MAG: hypothetical protein ACC657_05625 [Thiohalomonadales bacterium]
MIDVFCVYWGDKYDIGYVYALRDMVKKYLTIEHEFKCITTRKIEGINTVLPYVCYHGWWQKIGLFAPRIATRRSIYLDLDVVITGNINYLAEYEGEFCAPENWAQSGHGGIQSSVMVWQGNWHLPYEKFCYAKDRERYWGDQEYLTDLLNDWEAISNVGSYKYHCRTKIPKELNIICFHGKPDPHEVTDKWILPYIQTLIYHIKSSTPNVLDKVF